MRPLCLLVLLLAMLALARSDTIFVKLVNGKTITLNNVKTSNTIGQLKGMIQSKANIPPDQQRIIFGGKQLVDSHTLASYKIRNGATLTLSLRIRGGRSLTSLLHP